MKTRFEKAVQPCHIAAHLHHPRYRGENLSPDQGDQALTWLCDGDADFLAAVITIDTKSAPILTTNIYPSTWWLGLKKSNLPSDFTDLMVALHTATASSASVEHVFSTFSLVNTRVRNRLGVRKAIGVRKASKLVFCYRMLRGN